MRLNRNHLRKLILQEVRRVVNEGGLAGMASREHEMMDEPLPGTFGHSRGAIDDLDMAAGRAMGFDDGPLSGISSFVADEFDVDPEAEDRYEEAKRLMPNASLRDMLNHVFGI